jgi:Ankyrin repeats (3 copies)
MKNLLDQDAKLNAADLENETALHGAVFSGHIDAVEFLLKQGISLGVRGVENGTALDMAKSAGQLSIVKLLSGETDEETTPRPERTKSTATKESLKVDATESQSAVDPVAEALVDKYLTMMLVISAQNGNLEDVKPPLEAGISPQGN